MALKQHFQRKLKCSEKNNKWAQILVSLTGCLAAFNSGLCISWTSPAIPKLIANDSAIPMTFEQTSYFSVIHPLVMCLFCPLAIILMNYFGQKKVILYLAIPQIASWLLTAFSVNYWMLYIARALVGFADALIFSSLPVYIGEICEKHMRGPLGCFLMVYFYTGQVVMNAIGYYFDIPTAALISCAFPTFHFICFYMMPESPYWLIEKQKMEEAKKSLQILRWRENVEEEFVQIEEALKRQLSEQGSIKDLFTSKCNRRAFGIAMNTRAAQQFSGMTAFFVYLQYIFNEAGGNLPSHVSSILCMGLMAVGAFFSTTLIDRYGRRPLILTSGWGCIIILILQATYFYLKTVQDLTGWGWFPLVSMLIYILFFSIGYCTVPTMILGELFSASVKGKAVMIANMAFALFVLAGTKIFQLLTDYINIYAPFIFYAIATIIINIVLYFTLIETKNKTLEEIQQILKNPKNKKPFEKEGNC